MNRLTAEKFIEKAKAVHGDRYDYSKVEYVDYKTEVTIICPDHGDFKQRPTYHLAGNGCQDCGGTKKLTTKTFIKKAKAIHKDRYDYSKVEYVNSQTKVTIICPDHGDFRQKPAKHLMGRGCDDCGGTKELTTETFIEKANAIHKDRYDYSQVEYVDNKTDVIIICRDHGPFPQAPNSHLSGRGCGDCAGNKPLTTETFIEKAKAFHGDRYDYSQVEYVSTHTEVTIICPDHGSFPQTPASHLQGNGCGDCAGNKPLTTETFIEKAKAVHGDRYDYSKVEYVNIDTNVTIICRDHGDFPQIPYNHIYIETGCPDCADYGFNPSEPCVLYYIAVTTDDGDTRYKIGITKNSVQDRYPGPDLARIRIIKTWRYAIGRSAAEREAEILRQYAGDRYFGPDILLRGGNSELFTHDILGLDRCDEANV